MREILFKAKRIDNGEWVEGYVFDDGFVDSKRMFVGGLVIMDYKGTADDRWEVGTAFYEVDHNTICQYTGFIDKNDTKIFEGDIVNASWGYKGLVDLDNLIYASMECRISDDIEVIGNIFDNPELLKGGAE